MRIIEDLLDTIYLNITNSFVIIAYSIIKEDCEYEEAVFFAKQLSQNMQIKMTIEQCLFAISVLVFEKSTTFLGHIRRYLRYSIEHKLF